MSSAEASTPARPSSRGDERYVKRDRLRRRAEYLAVQDGGKKAHAGHFLVFRLVRPVDGTRRGSGPTDAGETPCRLGITVTRKIGGAVVRNRLKRLVREVFRRERSSFPPSCDLVVVAKQGSEALTYAQVREDLLRYVQRLDRGPEVRPSQAALVAGPPDVRTPDPRAPHRAPVLPPGARR